MDRDPASDPRLKKDGADDTRLVVLAPVSRVDDPTVSDPASRSTPVTADHWSADGIQARTSMDASGSVLQTDIGGTARLYGNVLMLLRQLEARRRAR